MPEYVFLEVTTVLAARVSLSLAAAVGQTLLQARELELVPCSDVFLEAFSIFRSQGQRGLSFTDAPIVSIARREGASRVATFDSDFAGVEGLTVVPGGTGNWKNIVAPSRP